jgi:hypothetical protein
MRPPADETPSAIALVPLVTTGLYDDYEEDLGVP